MRQSQLGVIRTSMKMPSVRHNWVIEITPRISMFALMLGLMLGMSACESSWTQPGDETNEHAMAAASDPIAIRIAESADKAATALQDLARVEQTKRPPTPEPPAVAAPNELHMPVTIDWVGGAEPLVRNIATRLKYDVMITGAEPPVPIIVQIHQRDREVLEALRSIGDQATQNMDLVVDPLNHKIEIRYIKPEPRQS